MNSESESSLDTDQHFNENISGTKKRTKGSRARTRSGSTTSKTDCDPSDNPQSEVATMKQVRTKRNWKKKKKERNKRTETKNKKNNVNVCEYSSLDRGRLHDSHSYRVKISMQISDMTSL